MAGNTAGTLRVAIELHGQLCKVVAPATPASIRISLFRRNGALQSIAGFAAFFFLLGVLSSLCDFNGPVDDILQILAAASIGSAFYTLTEASKYMKAGTFSPRYSQDYLIRYALGVVAGFIIAQYGPELFSFDNAQQAGGKLQKLAPATLALIGGFAADAVYDFLKRIGETLSTLVRGSDSARAEAKAEKEKNQERAGIAKALQRALGETDPAKREEAIQEVIHDVLN